MKKLAALGVTLVLLTAGVALAITENQAMVAPVLEQLKLKHMPSEVIGGPQKYQITDETLELLTKAKKSGQVIVLKPDGSIELVKGK
ncbi:hypothetical protein [Bremerella alba]|uniref:Uncharacterized protein n=1 Tax=Bremerella alba TaxID=980252 RepID=A0A7V9A896_9BACT|nr:hypothetical protein [Bremerella alba]MBA2116063.1 hypothetical protein [Bremerella alba]